MQFLFPLFALMQKVEQKNQGQMKGSAHLSGPRTRGTVITG